MQSFLSRGHPAPAPRSDALLPITPRLGRAAAARPGRFAPRSPPPPGASTKGNSYPFNVVDGERKGVFACLCCLGTNYGREDDGVIHNEQCSAA